MEPSSSPSSISASLVAPLVLGFRNWKIDISSGTKILLYSLPPFTSFFPFLQMPSPHQGI